MSSSGIRDIDSTDTLTRKSILEREKALINSLKTFEETTSISGLAGGGSQSSGGGTPSGNYMKRDGDEWLASFGNSFGIVEIDGGFINGSKTEGVGERVIVVNAEGASPDFLDTIQLFPTEFVFLEKIIFIADDTVTLRPPLSATITNIVGNGVDDVISVTVSDILSLADDDHVLVTAPGGFSTDRRVKIFNVSGNTFEYNLGSIGSTTPQTSGNVARGNLQLPSDIDFVAPVNSLLHFTLDPINQKMILDYASNGIDSGASSDVTGPASSTDNAIARFDGTTGKIIQNSGILIDDSDSLIMNANAIILDADQDTKIQAGTDDVMQFTTGSTVQLSLSNTSAILTQKTFFLSDIDLNANEIILDADGDTKIQAGTDDVMQFTTGSTVQLSLSNTSAVITQNTTIGGDLRISGGQRIRSTNSTEIGIFVTDSTATIGTAGSLQIPTTTATGIGNATALNAAFGSAVGCIGVFGTNASLTVLAIKLNSTTWGLLTIQDGGVTVTSDKVT